MKCHCDGELIKHVGGLKDGCFHCNECFCCMEKDGNARAGHPGCGRFGFARPVRVAIEQPVAEEEVEPVRVKLPKRRSVK